VTRHSFSQLTLLDWVEGLLLGDLKLGVGPSRDLDDHLKGQRQHLDTLITLDLLLSTVLDSSAKRGMSLRVSLVVGHERRTSLLER
jgi:hypothetical protein